MTNLLLCPKCKVRKYRKRLGRGMCRGCARLVVISNKLTLCPKCKAIKYHTRLGHEMCYPCFLKSKRRSKAKCPKCEKRRYWILIGHGMCYYCFRLIGDFPKCPKCGKRKQHKEKYCYQCRLKIAQTAKNQ